MEKVGRGEGSLASVDKSSISEEKGRKRKREKQVEKQKEREKGRDGGVEGPPF